MKLTAKKLTYTKESTFFVELTFQEIEDLMGACNAGELYCSENDAPLSARAYSKLWVQLYDMKKQTQAF